MSGPNGENCSDCYYGEEQEEGVWCHHSVDMRGTDVMRDSWWCDKFTRRDKEPTLKPQQCAGCRSTEYFLTSIEYELWSGSYQGLMSLPFQTDEQRAYIKKLRTRYRKLREQLYSRDVDNDLTAAVGLLARWLTIHPDVTGDLGAKTRKLVTRYEGEENAN